jgi:hypothetical protein
LFGAFAVRLACTGIWFLPLTSGTPSPAVERIVLFDWSWLASR